MRRLLSLAVMAGLAAPFAAAADNSTTKATITKDTTTEVQKKPVLSADQAAHLPSFLRTALEEVGIAERPMNPWIAWWVRTFGIDPDTAHAHPSATTASR